MVRAKFKVTKIERSMTTVFDGVDPVTQRPIYTPKEIQTIHFIPVFGPQDPDHENSKFWAATPQGAIQLGCVNAEAVAQFGLEQEFYVDFTPAGQPAPAPVG